jgi:hypothetical protein
MTCSWCGKKISFLRAITDTEYCSSAHREQEEQSMRKLAIERLRECVVLDRPAVNA